MWCAILVHTITQKLFGISTCNFIGSCARPRQRAAYNSGCFPFLCFRVMSLVCFFMLIKYTQGWTQRGCLREGTSIPKLEPRGASRERGGGGSMSRGGGSGGSVPRFFFKIYVSENAFQAILKLSFSYSITTTLSKVRHSNPGGVYSDIFIHTYIGSGYFFVGGGSNFLNFDIFWGFQKNDILFGMKILWIFFFLGGGSSQNWAIFRGHFYAFEGLFLRSTYRMGDIFWVAKI